MMTRSPSAPSSGDRLGATLWYSQLGKINIRQVRESLEVGREVGEGPLGVPQVESPQLQQGGQWTYLEV